MPSSSDNDVMDTPVNNNIDTATGGLVATPAAEVNIDGGTGGVISTPDDNIDGGTEETNIDHNIDGGTGGEMDTPVDNVDDAMDDSISESSQSRLDNELLAALADDNANLRQENRELRAQLNRGSLDENGFRDDNDKVRFFTGIPSFMIMTTVFGFLPWLFHLSKQARSYHLSKCACWHACECEWISAFSS